MHRHLIPYYLAILLFSPPGRTPACAQDSILNVPLARLRSNPSALLATAGLVILEREIVIQRNGW